MTDEKKEEEKKAEPAKAVRVTADHDVDFPSLDWGINAGQERDLPADPKAAAEILKNSSIKIIK